MKKEEVAEKWKKSRWGVKTEEAMQVLYGCTDGVDLNKVVPETDILHGLYDGDGEAFETDVKVFFGDKGVGLKYKEIRAGDAEVKYSVGYPWRGREAEVVARYMLCDSQLIDADPQADEIRTVYVGREYWSGRVDTLRVFPVPDGKTIEILGTEYALNEIRHITVQGDLLSFKTDREEHATMHWEHDLLGTEKQSAEVCNAVNKLLIDRLAWFSESWIVNRFCLEEELKKASELSRQEV